jgi:maleylpyruvate isomerase
MKLRLYHYWRSTSSWRVRWALAIKGIAVEMVPVNLLDGESESPEHRARNPMGYVPALENLDHPSAPYLIQSMAIIHWLDEIRPEPSLFGGTDPWIRAHARELAEIINADTQPLQNLSAQDLHSNDPAARKAWAQHWIQNGLQACEAIAAKTSGRFAVGDSITVADICIVPQIYNARRFDVELDAFPTLLSVEKAAMNTEGYRLSEPSRFEPKKSS